MENKEILVSFAKRLKELRESNKMTQKDFAKKIGVTTTALSSYENGKQNPSITIAVKIAKEFNVSTDWLFNISKDITPIKPQTYSDIIAVLFRLDSLLTYRTITENIYIPPYFGAGTDGIEGVEAITGVYEDTDVISFFFKDYNMKKFMEDWKKMSSLYHQNSIDDEVYNLWVQKTLEKYAVKIDPKKDYFPEPLPF